MLGSWRKNRTNPGSRASGQDKKKGVGDRAADGGMVEIHRGKMGPEPSYKTDYLDLVGAYLVSNMTTFLTAAK